ncbi:DUF3108 domain-containing protein [Fulvivirga sp. M361]|uniref:DUF3108 domain-containing protein n=1 Tax=Fulvivirga sp. M361 TaxID=2594266 RepID=UPI00117AC5A8|nr:DUF3108 domain-containing protein [Fulvivirga sp. M361]TRX50676.1 DUF3108 domain-containing protein [Fulvivirga sp. M361]
MAKLFYSLLLLVTLASFTVSDDSIYKSIPYKSFARGEKLEYKISFGIFNIGEAEMLIDNKFYKVNHRDCYKVDIYGKTTGMVDWVANVNDHWGAYVDSSALVPHISYRKIREGGYKKDEVVRFDHRVNLIEAKVKNKKTGEFKEPKVYVAPKEVRDMLAGYLYLRTIDFSSMAKGDIFRISGFFEDAFYELDIKYRGKDKIKTKAGKFKAIKLEPIMPNNELFDGEDSILAWISDDENKVPLKVQAKMFIGNVGVELKSYENVKNPLNLVK